MAAPLFRCCVRPSRKVYDFLLKSAPVYYSSEIKGSDQRSVNQAGSEDLETSIASALGTMNAKEDALHKFAKIVEKVNKDKEQNKSDVNAGNEQQEGDSDLTFASVLRKSKLVALGEVEDKRVEGKIIEVMENDLYIDIGGKFHCVCPRPRHNANKYRRGAEVVVSLRSLEMSSAFLGSDIDITLLEADAVLLGLSSRKKSWAFVKMNECKDKVLLVWR